MPPEATKGIFRVLCGARQQDHIGNVVFAGMPAAFKAIDAHRIATNRFSLQRVAHRSAFVDDLNAGFLERRQLLLRIIARGLDDLHAAIDDGLHEPG